MIKHIFASAALTIAPLVALAETVCEMGDATPYPVIEEAKAAFLASEFSEFSQQVTALMSHQRAPVDSALKQLEEIVPRGFDSCATILQRVERGGMVQEIATFNVRGGAFPVAVYFLAIPIRDDMGIALFNFNTTLEEVLDSIR